MKGNASRLIEFLDGAKKRFIIPVYQRNYDWKKDNCRQLFDDLVNLIRKDKESHFFGSIVSCAHRRDEIILIDGQQRITTVSLILIAMINAIKNGACTPENPTLCEEIEETYIIDKYRREERKVRLKPFRDDCEAFDRLIFKGEEEYVKNSKVTLNYQYFYHRITQDRELSVDDLFRAIERLEIIDIQLEPEHGDDPQLIFESLNSTGLDLTESDKIRNFILMGLDPVTQEEYYDQYWNPIEKYCRDELDSFVRNFLTITTNYIPNIRSIYTAFKEYARKQPDIEQVLRNMLRYARVYSDLANYNLGSVHANEVACRLNLLEVTVAHPFLMAFVEYARNNSLPQSEIERVLSCVEVFIFRRLICDLPSNVLGKIFAHLHKSVLKNLRDDNSYSSVMIYLLEHRKQTGDFPKDEDFLSAFTTKNIYRMKSKVKEYLFERLENSCSKETNDVIRNIENGTYTIEHIMPQTLSRGWQQALGSNYEEIQEKWLHTIANLTLSGYNSNYSNKSFQEKKTMPDGFAESGLRLNQYIAKFDQWTEAELECRREHLSEAARSIWKYPTTDFVPVQKEEDIIELSEDNEVAVGREILYFTFQDTRYNVSCWADMVRELIKLLYHIDPAPLYSEAFNPDNVWLATTCLTPKYDRLDDGLYLCAGNSSTWNKMSFVKNIFHRYNLSEDELSFGVTPLKEEQKEPSVTTWLIPANENYFRLDDWFSTHEEIFWRQTVRFKTSDKVYFYKTQPQMCICYLAEVEADNLTDCDLTEERAYYVTTPQEAGDTLHARLKLVAKSEHPDKLSWEQLQAHGLNGTVQGGRILKDDLLDYITSNF